MLCLLAHGDCLIVECTNPLAVADIPHGLFRFHIKRGKAWEQLLRPWPAGAAGYHAVSLFRADL